MFTGLIEAVGHIEELHAVAGAVRLRIGTTLAVETLLYQVSDATLLWASVSQTTNPKDAGTFMKGLTNAIVKELQKEGMVSKVSK